MEGKGVMIISFKMVDGSRIDVQANKYQEEKLYQDLNADEKEIWQWWQVYNEEWKKIILRTNNIVSITVKGDDNDSKGIS